MLKTLTLNNSMIEHTYTHTSELKAAELESNKAIANLNEVDEGIEVIRSHDETVSSAKGSPAAQQQIPT